MEPVDESSDVFSYGASLYTVLSGNYLETDVARVNGREAFDVSDYRCCFRCCGLSDLWHSHSRIKNTVAQQLKKASTLLNLTDYSTSCLWNVTQLCVSFEPADRPSMTEVIDELEACIEVVEGREKNAAAS